MHYTVSYKNLITIHISVLLTISPIMYTVNESPSVTAKLSKM